MGGEKEKGVRSRHMSYGTRIRKKYLCKSERAESNKCELRRELEGMLSDGNKYKLHRYLAGR